MRRPVDCRYRAEALRLARREGVDRRRQVGERREVCVHASSVAARRANVNPTGRQFLYVLLFFTVKKFTLLKNEPVSRVRGRLKGGAGLPPPNGAYPAAEQSHLNTAAPVAWAPVAWAPVSGDLGLYRSGAQFNSKISDFNAGATRFNSTAG